jgi:hypothetical protein
LPAAPLIDDMERNDGRTSLDTLRTDNPDGGRDRTVEVSEVVPAWWRPCGVHGSAHGDEAGCLCGCGPPIRGAIRPVDVRLPRHPPGDIRGKACTGRLSMGGVAGAGWATPIPLTEQWQTIEVPFASLKPESRRHPVAWSGRDITQVGSAPLPGRGPAEQGRSTICASSGSRGGPPPSG